MDKWFAGISFFCFFLWGVPMVEAGSGTPPEDIELTERTSEDGKEGVSARMLVAAPSQAVWNLLTDYNRLAEIVPDLLISRVVGEEEGDPILYQQGKVRIFFYVFRGSVTLRVHEEPYRKISFNQKSGDFKYFEGDWSFKPTDDGAGTEVIYTLWAHPKFYVPHWLLAMMLKRDIPKRLHALREHVVSSQPQPARMESDEPG